MIKILPLNKFRLLKKFQEVFKINEDTVIAYNDTIYCNKNLPEDVLEHEKTHLKQQKKYGLDNFIKKYINDKKFRLEMEKEAYLVQLNSITDEGLREAVKQDCLEALQSGLYGNITEKEAKEILEIKDKKLDVNKLI